MADRFLPGSRVCTRRADPAHHTRLPRYARGAVGVIVETEGRHPLADDRARGLPSATETVYSVRFAGADLFGEGDHEVTMSMWESYLDEEPG